MGPADAAFARERALDRLARALLNELQVLLAGRGGAREVAGLEHLDLLRAEELAEAPADVLADVHLVEPRVAERVARNSFAALRHLLDDVRHARALGDEDVHAVVLLHDRPEALGLSLEVDAALRHVDSVDVLAFPGEVEPGQELHCLEHLAVVLRRLVGEPSAVAPHHLVDRERARVGAALLDHVREEPRAFLRRRPGAEGLLDGIDVVVDRLGESDDDQRVVVLREVCREVRRRRVGVVAADGVEHVDAVLDELVRRDLQGVLALLDEPALHAVRHVRELHAAVADRRAAVYREHEGVLADFVRDRDRLSLQKPHVAVDVSDHLNVGGLLRVFVNQIAD